MGARLARVVLLYLPERAGVTVVRTATLDVFIVDDEAFIGQILVETLRDEGFRVSWAPSADEGLEHLARAPARLVLSDVMLPGMNGVEMLEQLRRLDPVRRPRCILMSAGPRPMDMPPDVPFLRKPFELDVVVDLVREVLRAP
jgi:DNA-binding response OmpR family regulator